MKPLTIGHHTLDAPMAQAALSGYSDLPMRRLAREYGCPYTINEVVLDKMVAEGGRKMRRMLAVHPDEHPVAGQLMGSEPSQFAEAANTLVELGYDAIDVNFGCPVKKVLGRCRGGFLLSDPQTAVDILRNVRDAVAGRTPVTLKMRRGMDDSEGSERNFFAILDAAFELGFAAVTVHGRTVVQRYVGPSHWPFLERVKRHVGDRTILGSGDLFSAEDCRRMLEETGIDGVSIARGAIGNPFIFNECRSLWAGRELPPAPSIADQRRAIERHFELMVEHWGPERASVLFRKYGVRYAELHPLYEEVKMAFVAVRSVDLMREALEKWYAEGGDYPRVTRRLRPEALVAAGASLECDA
ncbi:MAG: tRNA-dihydrouridine synthase family protein [Phycisphaerales bacterium]|nr:tRNA-dihydrouridine synthase family protein [Phycisphaerales bacterium]